TYHFKGGINKLRKDYGIATAEEFIFYQRQGVKFTNDSRAQGNVNPIDPDIQHGYGFSLPDIYDIGKITNENRGNFNTLINEGWLWMFDPYTDFQDTIVFRDYEGIVAEEAFNQNPIAQDHNISFSGGNDRSTFYSSLNYYSEEGIASNTKYERYSAMLSSTYKLAENIDILAGFTYSNSNTDNYTTSDNFYRARIMRPTFVPFDEAGNPNSGVSESYGNPAYYQDKFVRLNNVSRTNFNFGANWEILPDLFL